MLIPSLEAMESVWNFNSW